MDRKKILLVFLSFIFIVVVTTSLLPKNSVKQPTQTALSIPKSTEISCEEAKNIALGKYPGKVLNNQEAILTEKHEKVYERKVCVINIKPSELKSRKPIGSIEITVDRNTKDIFSSKYIFK